MFESTNEICDQMATIGMLVITTTLKAREENIERFTEYYKKGELPGADTMGRNNNSTSCCCSFFFLLLLLLLLSLLIERR